MIARSAGGGYEVRSHQAGHKRLSRPGMSKAAAIKRLRQIQYFKRHPSIASGGK